jgi:hypothetical protein
VKNSSAGLKTLEGIRKLQDGPVRLISFVHADGRPIEATVANGPGGFICRRAIGEELDAFKSRASDECRATNPRGPAILVFLEREPSGRALIPKPAPPIRANCKF